MLWRRITRVTWQMWSQEDSGKSKILRSKFFRFPKIGGKKWLSADFWGWCDELPGQRNHPEIEDATHHFQNCSKILVLNFPESHCTFSLKKTMQWSPKDFLGWQNTKRVIRTSPCTAIWHLNTSAWRFSWLAGFSNRIQLAAVSEREAGLLPNKPVAHSLKACCHEGWLINKCSGGAHLTLICFKNSWRSLIKKNFTN